MLLHIYSIYVLFSKIETHQYIDSKKYLGEGVLNIDTIGHADREGKAPDAVSRQKPPALIKMTSRLLANTFQRQYLAIEKGLGCI